MSDLKWKDAIEKVLKEERKALHYSEITELISERGYKVSIGATPRDSVSSCLTTDINANKEKSIFAKVDRGIYILREFLDNDSQPDVGEPVTTTPSIKKTSADKSKFINSFGIYWQRDLVHWKSSPDLLGIQQIGATEVNFKDQIGVYLLHDARETVYVGQAIEQSLGQRLRNHTLDRLSGRWNRFSWFGLYPVTDKANLVTDLKNRNITVQEIGDLLEAILIECIEPRQNRKQGNLFSGIEYLQKESPEIKKKMKEQLIRELTDKL